MRCLIGTFALACVLTLPGACRADKLVLFAGGGTASENVPATEALLQGPFGIDFDSAGSAYIVELAGGRLLQVDSKGTFHILAGSLKKKSESSLAGESGDNGPGRDATFNGMHSLAVHPSGDIYLADTWNNRIRKYDPKSGTVSAFAGTGKKAYGGDGGPGLKADFTGVFCICLNAKGDKLYVTDLENRRIRVIDVGSGQVDLVAGNGMKGVPTDGADARTAPLVDPRACTVDRKGNVYILERGGNALRVVDPQGKIRTVVGTGKAGNTGDGGGGRKATMNGPKHLCVDRDDNVIIADTANHVIRKYTPADDKIVRLAGTGKKGPSGTGGDPFSVSFNEPHGVLVHPNGTLYIVDSGNHRIFRWQK